MIYVLCRLNKIGYCESEEFLKASLDKDSLIKYAEEYHMDMLDEMTYYTGLVIYETDGNDEPYLAYEWNM